MGLKEELRNLIREELNAFRTEFLISSNVIDKSIKRPWHPSDEAALEKYLELAIKDWAHNFSRTELAIKYKIAKIIKNEGIKV